MKALKHHLVHHRFHMLGCVVGALIAVLGGIAGSPVISIAGAIICGGFCLDMIRMMVVMKPRRG
jgi:hypothetical protein